MSRLTRRQMVERRPGRHTKRGPSEKPGRDWDALVSELPDADRWLFCQAHRAATNLAAAADDTARAALLRRLRRLTRQFSGEGMSAWQSFSATALRERVES